MANKQRRAASLLLPFLLLLVLAAAWGRSWLTAQLQPVTPGAVEPMTVVVPGGASTREVAELLYGAKLIKEPTVFRYYARYRKLDAQLKPGEYQLSAGMTPEQILQKLTRGETVTYRFTVPEGLTVEQIAEVLHKKQVVDKERFLRLAATAKLNAAHLPKGVHLRQPLEGYLFPATYEYKKGISEDQVIAMMYERFEKVWTADLRKRAEDLNLSVHDVVTLASIIEKEAQVAAERVVISGVYHNRLKIGMKLDADPTVRYAVNKPVEEDLLYADLDVASPYNTYRNAGLPPGPIAAPGEASLKAALQPAAHDFWYFVAKNDGTGEHYFAATLDEQDRNIGRARANGGKKN